MADKSDNTEAENPKPLDYEKDIHSQSIEEILSTDNGDSWEQAEENAGLVADDDGLQSTKAEENYSNEEKEVKTEEPQPQEEQTEEKPQPEEKLNTQQLKSEIAEEVVKAITTGNETKQEKDDLLDLVNEKMKDAPWVKEGRNPSYLEAVAWTTKIAIPLAAQQAKEELERQIEEEDAQEQAAQQVQQEEKQRINQAWQKQWDDEFATLEASGEIPPIKASNTDSKAYAADPGVKARVAIMQKMSQESQARQLQGKPILTNVVQTYYQYVKPSQKENEQPAGADAPIFGSQKSVTQSNPDNYSYDEIHGKSVYDILSGK